MAMFEFHSYETVFRLQVLFSENQTNFSAYLKGFSDESF